MATIWGNCCGIYESNFIDALKALITHLSWLNVQFIDLGIQRNTFLKNRSECISLSWGHIICIQPLQLKASIKSNSASNESDISNNCCHNSPKYLPKTRNWINICLQVWQQKYLTHPPEHVKHFRLWFSFVIYSFYFRFDRFVHQHGK